MILILIINYTFSPPHSSTPLKNHLSGKCSSRPVSASPNQIVIEKMAPRINNRPMISMCIRFPTQFDPISRQ
jgi:hypothetical protein